MGPAVMINPPPLCAPGDVSDNSSDDTIVSVQRQSERELSSFGPPSGMISIVGVFPALLTFVIYVPRRLRSSIINCVVLIIYHVTLTAVACQTIVIDNKTRPQNPNYSALNRLRTQPIFNVLIIVVVDYQSIDKQKLKLLHVVRYTQ